MVPFIDLQAQVASIRDEVQAAIGRVLDSCQFVLGEEVAAFEREFAAYCGTKDAVAVNSGTSALHLALLAAGIGPGDEVITTPFTFVATCAAVLYTGARPVMVDIDPRTFTIDPALVEEAITPRTRAVVPVHLYGQPVEIDPLLDLARRHDLVVIEDAAQAHGAESQGRRVGSFGHLACFSFYPGKNLGAYGEGGAVTTSDSGLARTVRMLRDWGQERKHAHVLKGYNCRMSGFQGAILRVKLRHLDRWTEARRDLAARYAEALAGLPITLPFVRPDVRHVYHLYVVRAGDRQALADALAERGISTGIHYPKPVHLVEAYSDLGGREGQCPHAEAAAAQVLSLPLFPEMSAAQVTEVSQALHEILT